ncbi:unnamed protein product [Symbiodinium natans]|nr:unnamed protein product [Symbiodinium natans]
MAQQDPRPAEPGAEGAIGDVAQAMCKQVVWVQTNVAAWIQKTQFAHAMLGPGGRLDTLPPLQIETPGTAGEEMYQRGHCVEALRTSGMYEGSVTFASARDALADIPYADLWMAETKGRLVCPAVLFARVTDEKSVDKPWELLGGSGLLLAFYLVLARSVDGQDWEVVDKLLSAALSTTIRVHTGRTDSEDIARVKMDWLGLSRKLGQLAPSLLLWLRWFHEGTKGWGLGMDSKSLKLLETKKVRYEGRAISKEKLELGILAGTLGLCDADTWSSAWSLEREFGRGLTDNQAKLLILMRAANKHHKEYPISEKCEALSHVDPKQILLYFFQVLLVAFRSEYANLDEDFREGNRLETFLLLMYMKLSLVALASTLIEVSDVDGDIKKKLQHVVVLFASPLEFQSHMDAASFDPHREFYTSVFGKPGDAGSSVSDSSVSDSIVLDFIAAVYPLFDGSNDAAVKKCSEDMTLADFPGHVFEGGHGKGSKDADFAPWRLWYKAMQQPSPDACV